MKLTENLRKIDEAVKSLGADAKKAANETAQINTKLKFDSSNVSLVAEKFDALEKELEANSRRLAGLRTAQEQLNEERKKETGTTQQSKDNLAEIEKLAANYANQIAKAEANQYRLLEATKQQKKNQDLIKAATEEINGRYATWIQLSQNLANFTNKIYNSLKSIASESGQLGVQLSSLSKRYNASVEDIQLWNRELQLATGQSELFTQSLSVMVKGMAQIAAGRGVAYSNTLKSIGVAYKDIAELSAGEQFETILQGLAGIENYSKRAAYAQQLFGDSGQYVASTLNNGIEGLEQYRKKAEAFGIVTETGAEALTELALKQEEAHSKINEAKADIAIGMLPIIETFADFVREVLTPAIQTVGKALGGIGSGGQVVIATFGALILIMPKVISLIANLNIALLATKQGATAASVALNLFSKSLGFLSIAGAVLGVLSLIITAFRNSAKAAEDATNEVNGYKAAVQGISSVGSEFMANTESYATANKEYYMQIDARIQGEGDTAISDENAIKVAQLTADNLNRALGEIVK